MGNRELEELWAEKEQRREEKVNSNWRRKSFGVKCSVVERFRDDEEVSYIGDDSGVSKWEEEGGNHLDFPTLVFTLLFAQHFSIRTTLPGFKL